MGREQRGTNSYYYKKEREGSSVKSVYVGRGEMAHLISKFEAHLTEIERLMRAKKSMEADELDRVEAALDRAVELTQPFTEATLLAVGFHTHHRPASSLSFHSRSIRTPRASEQHSSLTALPTCTVSVSKDSEAAG